MDVKELTAQLKEAIDKFNGQDVEVASLKTKLADMEQKMVLATADMSSSKRKELGEWNSEAEAKGFVDFMKNVLLHDSAELKQMSEGTDSEGGYLVPEEFLPTLVRLVEVYGLVRRGATVIPMSRDELNMPSLASGITTYWVGENSSITSSQPVFGQVKLVAKKVGGSYPCKFRTC